MGDTHGLDDEQHKVRNDLSGAVNGPVGQFGSIHGDVHMSWSQVSAGPAEAAFRERYYRRMLAEWEAAEEKKRRERERVRREAERKRKKAQEEAQKQAHQEEIDKRRVAGVIGALLGIWAFSMLSDGGWRIVGGLLIGLVSIGLLRYAFMGADGE